MDSLLIAASSSVETIMATLEWGWLILQVAMALGMVIFVHELGHFAVAKWCGVKCEKFYLGFDVGGWRFCRFQWGETEYGIGVIPLGGYVKMLGQDDNPHRAAEEMNRAKIGRETTTQLSDNTVTAEERNTADGVKQTSSQGSKAGQDLDGGDSPTDEPVEYDPRSYMAQSVPKRMAIISAGVVMNLIFAFVAAVVAYYIGVEYTPCEVGQLIAGAPAWQAGLEPGDKIARIGDGPDAPRFRDLKIGIGLGDMKKGVRLLIERPGHDDPIPMTVFPERRGLMPMIGITGPGTTKMRESDPDLDRLLANYPASKTGETFLEGDELVAIGEEQVSAYADILRVLAQHPAEALDLTFRRKIKGDEDEEETAAGSPTDDASTETEEINVRLEANPLRRIGLVMELGPVVAVKKGSPAEAAGIETGDLIVRIDGTEPDDPMLLPDWFREHAGQSVNLTLKRPGQAERVEVQLTPQIPRWYEWPMPGPMGEESQPMSVPGVGVAYVLQNRIARVTEGSPAGAAGLGDRSGQIITAARLIPPKKKSPDEQLEGLDSEVVYQLGEKTLIWPDVVGMMQYMTEGAQVELTFKDGEKVMVNAPVASDRFNPDRGLRLASMNRMRTVDSVGEAVSLGWRETKESVFQVYGFLQKLSMNQISPKALGGPATIAAVAGQSAQRGVAELLIFLTMLSANLAVINFLPIPILDGGHMVFLVFEGVRGKPASERVFVAAQYAGLCLILSLMIFVLFLDANRVLGWMGILDT